YRAALRSAARMNADRSRRLQDVGKDPLFPVSINFGYDYLVNVRGSVPGSWVATDPAKRGLKNQALSDAYFIWDFCYSVRQFQNDDSNERKGKSLVPMPTPDGVLPWSPDRLAAESLGTTFTALKSQEQAAI